jgi:thioredoxin reductase
MHNFVTQDGTTPTEFRRIARRQLDLYTNVEARDVSVEEIHGQRGAFVVRLASGPVDARRILLCTGMIDDLPDIDGFPALWGTSIFQCPYCHGWEVQDRTLGLLAQNVETLDFALFLRGWTSDVVVLTDDRFDVPSDSLTRLTRAGVRVDARRIARLVAGSNRLEHVEFSEGPPLLLDTLFALPAQRQVPIVQSLGLTLDGKGYVQLDETSRETSLPGIHAGGDLVMSAQGALLAAASGMYAAAALNRALTVELATNGALP